LVPEGADKDVLYESDKALVRTDDKKAKPGGGGGGGGANKPKPRIPPKAQVGKSGQGSSTNTGVDAGIAEGNKKSKPTPNMGKDNDARSSRAYPRPEQTPAQAAAVKKEAAKPPEKMAADRSVSEHLANEFKPRSRGEGMKESALRARQDRVRRQVGTNQEQYGMKKGGAVKKMASGGMARSSASKRADGIAQRGKTRGKVC
jgi:hypothetical protein